MRKPDDIPQDVWDDAFKRVNSAVFTDGNFIETVSRAILAERERSASIAEEIGIPRVLNSDRIWMVPPEIAAAIRKGD